MAEKEAIERQKNTGWLVFAAVFQAVGVPILAFLLGGGAIYLGYRLASTGHDGLGLSAIITGAASLIGAFIAILRRPPNQ